MSATTSGLADKAPTAEENLKIERASSLEWALLCMARLKHVSLDPLALKASASISRGQSNVAHLAVCLHRLGLKAPKQRSAPDQVLLPMLAYCHQHHWVVVTNLEPNGLWQVRHRAGISFLSPSEVKDNCFDLELSAQSESEHSEQREEDSFSKVVTASMKRSRGSVFEAVVASVFISLLALMTSLFSMQIYDRVIPTRGEYTLIVLGVGVVMSILIELILKVVRAKIMDHVTVDLDSRLTRELFQRLLKLRIDQLPSSVGTLAGQLRGYEQVRSFFTASTLFVLVDVPMGFFFLLVIAVIASPAVSMVPLTLAVLALVVGIFARKQVNKIAQMNARFSNLKTGLLVEAVDGVETIKSGSGGWKFLSRWLDLNKNTIASDLAMRNTSEGVTYLAAAMHQLSYAGVVTVGALMVMRGDMTMGALIAASILSGRVLSPIMLIPGMLVQHAHARAALAGLDKLYELKVDNDGIDRVLIPEKLRGDFQLDSVSFSYGDSPAAISVNRLNIRSGERIGIIGPIGSGKSTLLRLLSGMYTPSGGRVLIDGLDMSHISRDVINRHIGYLQQEHRLFQGTLRENLLIGFPDPGDEVLLNALARTGMNQLLITHPLGLDRPIAEGGKGLSGGQRQLLAFTRLMLTQPNIMLLDEPTANMDQTQEATCLKVLQEEAALGKTMVIVTHKPSMLPLVSRVLVVLGNQIVMDGPRDQVISAFSNPAGFARTAPSTPVMQPSDAVQT